jgi:hypothetical protein
VRDEEGDRGLLEGTVPIISMAIAQGLMHRHREICNKPTSLSRSSSDCSKNRIVFYEIQFNLDRNLRSFMCASVTNSY